MNKQFQSTCLSVILLFTLSFTSCDLIDTREQQAKEKMMSQVATESGGYIKMTSFKKTDGVETNAGVEGYSMNFTMTIEYTNGCTKENPPFNMEGIWMYSSFYVNPNNTPAQTFFMAKGTKVRIYGTAKFEKHDSGWVLGKITLTKSENI